MQDAGLLGTLCPPARDALVSALIATEARARLARWELDRLDRVLKGMPAVPLVAMKGCAYLLAGLPNAAGRMFADVDLLVPEAALGDVERRLAENGWCATRLSPYDDRYYREWTHELPPMNHIEREVEVDLHHNILMRTARLSPDSARLIGEARPVQGSRFKVLAPVDMVLHSMTHLLFGGEMDDAIRELVDIDDLLRHFGEHEPGFWERFWPRAEELDLGRPAFYGLRYAHRLLGTPVPGEVMRAAEAGSPGRTVQALMDGLVPRTLIPQHPDAPSRMSGLARLLLYTRSHWVRMPAMLLVRHLSRKLLLRHGLAN